MNVAALALGALFGVTLIGKLYQPIVTLTVFREVWHLTGTLAHIGFVVLCVVEAALALWIIIGWRRRLAAVVATLILTVFTAGLIWQWIVAPELGCGCGLPSIPTTWTYIAGLARNGMALGLCVLLWRRAA